MKELAVEELELNPHELFGKNWMALAAGTKEHGYNAMTIAWGHLGSIWAGEDRQGTMPTAICYVRPSRYTKEFMDSEPYFSLNALAPERKRALGYLGSHSGRDGDKLEAAGLTPAFDEADGGVMYLAEAKLVFVCRTLYHAPLVEEGFVDEGLVNLNYPERDFHEMYVGEIVRVLAADGAEA